MEYAFAFMMGWCGTKWPGWWRWPRPPRPDPEPWWHLADGIIGGLGGIAAAILFAPLLDGAGLITTAITCFFGGLLAGTVVQSVIGLGERNAGSRDATESAPLASLGSRYTDAYVSADTATLNRLLHDDWILIPAGCANVADKRQQLRDLQEGVLRVESIEDSEVKVRHFGDTAVITGRRRSKAIYARRDVSDDTRFTQVYVRDGGEWRCVTSHVSSIPAMASQTAA